VTQLLALTIILRCQPLSSGSDSATIERGAGDYSMKELINESTFHYFIALYGHEESINGNGNLLALEVFVIPISKLTGR
jgi:hypothetical protein